MPALPRFSDTEILALRPRKNSVDAWRPYAYLVEDERSRSGRVEPVATIFLTNRECPLRCLMCDLWRNTLDERTPAGAIPAQIDFALARLPPARHVKLYNSGNFFDPLAIPVEDYEAIATRVRGFETVIVENHPLFCNERCRRFRDLLGTGLDVALGLETVRPEILAVLNKRMTVADFQRAVEFLRELSIPTRAFLLLKAPFQSEAEGVDGALETIEFAFHEGVECCSVIPTRAGNGMMEQLQKEGHFSPPQLKSLESVLEDGLRIGQGRGRVLVDLWDVESLIPCSRCGPARLRRLEQMNHTQSFVPGIFCECGTN
jgi:archaeosine synthase beta-subunit